MSHAAIGSSSFASNRLRSVAPALAATAAVLFVASGARADLIASWNFNGIDPALGAVIPPSTGSGMLDFTDLGSGAAMLTGTTLGAMPGEAAGDSLCAVGTVVNGKGIVIEVPTAGYGGLSLVFATRRSSTGAATGRIEHWSNLGWTAVDKFSASTVGWELESFDLSSLLAVPTESLRLRILVDGATSGSGSIRFDNLAVTGSAVPAPGALALLGVAGCVARRRRR